MHLRLRNLLFWRVLSGSLYRRLITSQLIHRVSSVSGRSRVYHRHEGAVSVQNFPILDAIVAQLLTGKNAFSVQ